MKLTKKQRNRIYWEAAQEIPKIFTGICRALFTISRLTESKDYRVCAIHRHNESCYGEGGKSWGTQCEMSDKQWYPVSVGIEKVLAEFFEIDLKKIELEKQQMLKELRAKTL